MQRYFAYGSNMCSARLTARTPSARAIGVGHVTGRELRFHKPSQDGSGKADAAWVADLRSVVWGVVYAIDDTERRALDRAEGGYEAVPIVAVMQHETLECFLYQAVGRRDAGLQPYCWYKAYLVQGAREHGLPSDYRRMLEATAFVRDPDALRRQRNRVGGADQ